MGWFSPKCPVEPAVKDWVEDRLSWLVDCIGEDSFRNSPDVTPQSLDLASYSGTEDEARNLFHRVCEGMRISPDASELQFYRTDHRPGVIGSMVRQPLHWAGRFWQREGSNEIFIDAALIGLPETLVATYAHELAHEILIGRGLIDPDSVDHEMVTDLATVAFGFGLFGANDSLNDEYRIHRRGDSIARTGYLPADAWSYALALRANAGERDIDGWIEWGRPLIKKVVRKSTRFLAKTDSPFAWKTDFLSEEQREQLCRFISPQAMQPLSDPEPTDEPVDETAADVTSADQEPDLLETQGDWEPEATVMLLEAHELAKAGHHTEAMELLAQVVVLEDDNEVAWQQQAASLSALGRHREAIAAAQRAVDLEPDDLQSVFSRGAALVRGDRGEEGMADLQDCIRQTTGSTIGALTFKSRCWWLHGLGELSMNQDEAARTSFQQAIRCWQDWPEPHEALASLCERHGDIEQAEKHRAQARRRGQG